jgi:hypothetical protein
MKRKYNLDLLIFVAFTAFVTELSLVVLGTPKDTNMNLLNYETKGHL